MGSELKPAGVNNLTSIETASRHWEVSKSRLERTAPLRHDPAAVKSRVPGQQITGTAIMVVNDDPIVLLDVTPGQVFRHNVRNVRTYAGAAEATFGTVEQGDPVYYDRSPTMPANVYLSTSPLDSAGAANPVFGRIVLGPTESSSDFPKGLSTATSFGTDVMQTGIA